MLGLHSAGSPQLHDDENIHISSLVSIYVLTQSYAVLRSVERFK